jgi:hypothetical protein
MSSSRARVLRNLKRRYLSPKVAQQRRHSSAM